MRMTTRPDATGCVSTLLIDPDKFASNLLLDEFYVDIDFGRDPITLEGCVVIIQSLSVPGQPSCATRHYLQLIPRTLSANYTFGC